MAHHKSAIKRIGQNAKRNLRNRMVKTNVRSHTRKVREAIAAGDKASAQAGLKTAIGKLNRASIKGIIPKKRASRLVSRLTQAVNRVE